MDAKTKDTCPSGLAAEDGGGAFKQKSAGVNGPRKCTWRNIDLELFYILAEPSYLSYII